jgi:hypothetical protein
LQPRWSGDGRELFYVTQDAQLMVVQVMAETDFRASPPNLVFPFSPQSAQPGVEVSADGKRFLGPTPLEQTNSPITLVLNWTSELGKK